MDRISRIFGRKSETPESTDQARDLQSPSNSTPSEDESPLHEDEQFGLKFVSDSGEERVFTSLPISIGRIEGNDLVVKHETVSAKHALVYYDDRAKSICILDQDSLNGISIDGFPTRKNLLVDGAKVGFGGIEVTFRDTGYLHTSE